MDDVQRYVYRALRSDEDVMAGLRARDPAANRTISQALEEGKVASQFLEATISPEVALFYAKAYSKTSKQQIVEIDLEGFHGEVVDVSDPHACNCHDIPRSSKAYNFATKHKVVMIKGYIRPERLSNKVFEAAEYFRDYSGRQSFDDFVSDLPETMRQEVTRYWRLDTFSTRCRRPISKTSLNQAVHEDDAARKLVLMKASDWLSQEIEKLERLRARKKVIDAQTREISKRADREEARLKKEARVQKLEEERRERERQEEERLKKKLRAEERRGPKIRARCPEKDHLYDNFDRKALQVALGNGGYIAIWDRAKRHAWSNIPKSLVNKLNGRGYHQAHATMVALSPDSDDYYVQFSDESAKFSGPESFEELVTTSKPPSVVAFGEGGCWFVGWPSGRWEYQSLPRSLRNMLDSNRHRSVAKLSISGTSRYQDFDDAAWFIHWEDDGHPVWKLKNAPDSLLERLQEVQEKGGTVRSVEFGSYDEWVLRYAYEG